MSAVTFNQRCACGAEFVATVEDDGSYTGIGRDREPLSQLAAVEAIDVRMKRWERTHKGHTAKDAPDAKPPLGFRTSAISSQYLDGEDSDDYEDDDDD